MAIEIPYLVAVGELINKHWERIVADSNDMASPSVSDEFEILLHLMGLSRLSEYNTRVIYEQIRKRAIDVSLPKPGRWADLICELRPISEPENVIDLLDSARMISNGLVHANFKKVYDETKRAFVIVGIEYIMEKFDPPVIPFATTITDKGLNVVVKGDEVEARDNEGNEIPSRALVPDGTNDIHIDFKYFYQTGAFAFTYNVLLKAYEESVVTMEKVKPKKTG